MSVVLTYSKTLDISSQALNLEGLDYSIRQNSVLSSIFEGLSQDNNSSDFNCHFLLSLTVEQIQELENIILTHNGYPPTALSAQNAIKNAINFGNQLIIEFASENVLMGITQAGQTKAVADYLVDVTRYAQTGALYEVINEVDRLSTAGLPPELAPFITQTRLDEFKQKILDYLS